MDACTWKGPFTEGQDHDSDRLAISQREDWLVITAYSNIVILYGEGTKMSYALITALIVTLVAIVHGWRIYNRWAVQIGPHSISINVSWAGLVVAALLAIWGFSLND